MPYAQPDDFDAVAQDYASLTFLAFSARELVRWAAPRPGERWLDVATGTGEAARALAAAVGESGAVLATDLSAAMLQAAQQEPPPPQLGYAQADGSRLPVQDASQDGVLCAAGLFFMPDMVAALSEWRRAVRPGGRVIFSAFAGPLMPPLPAVWAARLAPLGLKPPAPPIGRIGSPQAAADLLRQAGWAEVRVETLTIPLPIASAEERWAHILAGLEGLPLRRLSAEAVAQLRDAHLAELAPYFAAGPTQFDVPLILASGSKI